MPAGIDIVAYVDPGRVLGGETLVEFEGVPLDAIAQQGTVGVDVPHGSAGEMHRSAVGFESDDAVVVSGQFP
ncbi:hypothetical protein [Nocardia paucivorans]|uniref:hypothetical protein n=1 Tax=Nocardia paucivorans TaxID=114259 RepID=UPI001FDEC156|nr:hypothetical protein [Nocardia paucivorans]